MPRTARKKSESGIYHVMFRGINQQSIFEDDKDYEKLIEVLNKYREKLQYEIYAYCLMPYTPINSRRPGRTFEYNEADRK